MPRVAITGLGVICGLGKNVGEFWHNAINGRSGIQKIQSVDTSKLRFQSGAEVRDYDPAKHFDGGRQDLLDRFAQFAVVAAREAITDAGLSISPELSPRVAVVTGSSVGGQTSEDAGFQDLYLRSRPRVHPLTIPRVMMNAGASHICMDLGITGPALTTSTACSSANHAIGLAFWMVRSGQVEVAIAGGSEAPFSFGLLKAWEAMRVVAPEYCRPFSKDRSGLVLGEGGAMLVLESLDRAVGRGATVYGEVVGFGMSADAHHVTQPTSAGPAQAMRSAISDASLQATDIGYINAHGTGTISNDATESRAIREVLGAHADRTPVSSTKSMHGHALGAAGAIEAVATVLALREGVIPPTIHFTESDPECNLNLVVNQARHASFDYALSNSFAFGGLNAVLAFRAHP
ncbi:MAG TPA: beta-ketoacyl-[acyl-carrier-protein] synthase family protein [Terriglobales bacterium]